MPHLAGASLEAPFFLGPLFYVAIGRQISTWRWRTSKAHVFCFCLSKLPSIFIKNSENKRYITLVPLVCFAKCGCLALLGQPQPHIFSYFHFTRNNWTKRENRSLKRSTQVSFYFQILEPGALRSYWLALQDCFWTCLMIRSSSLSKITANHYHFRRFVWLPSNLSVFS